MGKLPEPQCLRQTRAVAGKGPGATGRSQTRPGTRTIPPASGCPTAVAYPRAGTMVRNVPQAPAPALRSSEPALRPRATLGGGGDFEPGAPALPAAASVTPEPKASAPASPGARREPAPPPLTHRGAPSRVPDARPTLTATAPSAGWSSPPPSPTAGPRLPGRAAAAAPGATATTAPAADTTPRPCLAPHASRLTPSGARLLAPSPLAGALGRRGHCCRGGVKTGAGWIRFVLFLIMGAS